MPLSPSDIQQWAKLLDAATLDSFEVDRITQQVAELSIPEAYLIQDIGIELRQERGEKVIGYKMGLTSKAKMKQMGVDSPIYGVLTDVMRLADEAEISLDRRIHPKIEPEIAFFIEREIRAEAAREMTAEKALGACAGVCAAMELIDSRYRDFDFLLPDVVADNCSSSSFVLGKQVLRPSELDLGNLGMLMEINGKPVQFGASSAIYGHPADSLAELYRMLSARGLSLPAGSIVLAGAATAAVELVMGSEVKTSVQDLGSVTIHVGANYER